MKQKTADTVVLFLFIIGLAIFVWFSIVIVIKGYHKLQDCERRFGDDPQKLYYCKRSSGYLR